VSLRRANFSAHDARCVLGDLNTCGWFYPILAMTILTPDIIVVYGLLAHGGRCRSARGAKAAAQGGPAS
jgi:hypothetical protein